MKELSFKVSDISSSKEWAISGFPNTVQLSQLVNFRNEPNRDQEAQYLSLMSNRGVIRYEDKGSIGNKKPEDLTRCKRVCSGDLVVNSMNFKIGSFGISPFEGVVSTVYHVISPKQELLNTSYLNYWFGIDEFRSQAQNLGNGILEHRRSIREDRFGAIRIPLPLLETQQRIADYLDKETGEIDEMIENLEGLVGDLDNRKFQIVDDVLHGKVRVLNRESVDFAPLWKFAEVNPLTPEINQLNESEMVAFVPLEDVYPQNAKDDFGQISLGGNIASYTRFRNGDVLLPKVSPTVWHGRAMIADTNTPVGLASSEVHVLRAYEGINTRWIQLHFLSKSFLDEVRGELTGVAGLQRVSPLFIRNMKMMSISREEQDEIVAYLDEELTDLIEMLEQCSGLIEDLKARRSALITEVVSGRKEV
jgi:type I restriction enzyme S subunit